VTVRPLRNIKAGDGRQVKGNREIEWAGMPSNARRLSGRPR
jgi:hypothetical protein